MRAKEYDYRRLDEPWTNEELRYARIGIIGRDSSAVKLARILHDGFECRIYGYEASESLAFHGLEPMFITEILDRCDYIFMCTDRFGFQVPPDSMEQSLANGIVDSRNLPPPDLTMSESNVAILGTGGIGSIIARIALKGFKSSVTAYSRSEKEHLAGDGVVYRIPGRHENALQNTVRDANFTFISAKLPKGTPPMISGELIGSLPVGRERVIVNVARDDMVESEPLYQLLCRGLIRSYATDVLPNDAILWSGGKPDDMTRKYIQHSSVVPTPHEGDCSQRSLERLVSELLLNINLIIGKLI
jgi:phosphoglycerate dehydrogenase-like enzyme